MAERTPAATASAADAEAAEKAADTDTGLLLADNDCDPDKGPFANGPGPPTTPAPAAVGPCR